MSHEISSAKEKRIFLFKSVIGYDHIPYILTMKIVITQNKIWQHISLIYFKPFSGTSNAESRVNIYVNNSAQGKIWKIILLMLPSCLGCCNDIYFSVCACKQLFRKFILFILSSLRSRFANIRSWNLFLLKLVV